MAHLKHGLLVHIPVDKLDAIVRDFHRWPEFTVGMSESARVFGDGGPGTKAELTQLMMGVHLNLIYRTTDERHNPDGSTDWRWEFEGGASGWMTCHHQPRGGDAETTTELDYTVPGSVLGKVADRLLIEKRFRRDFENSLENLKLLAESTAAAPPAAATA
jgi:coenzyme Q-binding protein COQ10